MTNRVLFIVLFVVIGIFGFIVLIDASKPTPEESQARHEWKSDSYPANTLPSNVIVWTDDAEIHWSDFEAEKAYNPLKKGFSQVVNFDLFHVDCLNETYEVIAYFDKSKSWASLSEIDPDTRDYELRFVNLQLQVAELQAQKLRNFLYPIENLCDYGYMNINPVIERREDEAINMLNHILSEILENPEEKFPYYEQRVREWQEDAKAKYEEMENAGK
ncbi:MAG: hypothetical protein HWE14_03945 [Flavobacteriia bacterium]|nr:hypothetical protein [Flavobacteriia bacterium]